MAEISRITLPSGTTYDLKDAEARRIIEALVGGDAVVFMGVSTTPITDGGSEQPTISGETVTPAASITTADVTVKTGDAAYEASAPAFTGTAATVTVKGTPTGNVSQPTFTGDEATVTVS